MLLVGELICETLQEVDKWSSRTNQLIYVGEHYLEICDRLYNVLPGVCADPDLSTLTVLGLFSRSSQVYHWLFHG